MTAAVNKFRAALFLAIREKAAMHEKLFAFNAGSFTLDDRVEGFLRSRDAVALDFGSSAYISPDAMAAILPELVQKAEASSSVPSSEAKVVTLQAEISQLLIQIQKFMQDNAQQAAQFKALVAEIAASKEHVAGFERTIEALRAENSRLAATKNQLQPAFDDKMRLAYEKLAKEFHELRTQSVDAITSLKVLEDENDELREEIESLRAQAKNSPAATAR